MRSLVALGMTTIKNMSVLQAKIEAILFVATKPLSVKQLCRAVDGEEVDVRSAVAALAAAKNGETSGVHIVQNGDDVQMVTNPACAKLVEEHLAVELDPELTKPSVEALTIIAYRGPITKPEIEAIRGVNCSLIVRNLLLRGLIVETDDAGKMQPAYTLSTDALRYFGVHNAEELPDYAELHANAKIAQLLAALSAPATPDASV